jgi:hypothetical protein
MSLRPHVGDRWFVLLVVLVVVVFDRSWRKVQLVEELWIYRRKRLLALLQKKATRATLVAEGKRDRGKGGKAIGTRKCIKKR